MQQRRRSSVVRVMLSMMLCTCTLFPPVLLRPVSAAPKTVYLTFDDGPDPVCTPRILAVLRREHVHATFFLLGFRSVQYPAIVRQIHHDGHEIGNHGYSHTFIVHKSRDWVESDVRRADAAIEAISGTRPQYFRPPGGILSLDDVRLVTRIGHPIAMWTVDTEDWKARSSQSIVTAVESEVRPGSIILMHDGILQTSPYTAQALPVIIDHLRQQGFAFAVLPLRPRGDFVGGPTDTSNRRFARDVQASFRRPEPSVEHPISPT